MPRIKPTVLELCAGGGGLALGFEAAGFDPVALVDDDPHACATLRMNRPYWNVIEADLKKIPLGYWKGADVICAGLPCPPFSVAGKQLGEMDERNLFPDMLRIVAEVQPRAVLIENVSGILDAKFCGFRDQVVNGLTKTGLTVVDWREFNAVDFGVPQTRARSFLVAVRDHADKFVWPRPLKSNPVTVAQAIGDIMGSCGWRGLREWLKKANGVAPTLVGGSKKHGGADVGPSRTKERWRQLGVDGVVFADAPPARNHKGLPRLTVPMTARLQSFPDDWRFAGGKTSSYRQVGNAVPVRLAAAVAASMKAWLTSSEGKIS